MALLKLMMPCLRIFATSEKFLQTQNPLKTSTKLPFQKQVEIPGLNLKDGCKYLIIMR